MTGDLQIQLSWTQPASGAPTGYYIEQSSDGVNFVQVLQVSGSNTSATVSNLGKAIYYFKVSSYNSAAQSDSQVLTVNLKN